MHGLMIAIEYSYKLDRKNYFNLWCELGRLLLRQSHMDSLCTYLYLSIYSAAKLDLTLRHYFQVQENRYSQHINYYCYITYTLIKMFCVLN